MSLSFWHGGEPPLVRTRVCRRDTDDFVVGLIERFVLQVRVKVLEVEFVVDHRHQYQPIYYYQIL